MTKSNNDWLDEILDKNLEDIVDASFNGYNYALNKTAKLAITAKINEIEKHAYGKGYIDGGVEILNASCEVCHAYPMTADCNNANCHAIER